tara:strand:- start:1280 stop:1606 length:327 start_codon:yes stop_codon:yes gene_type:complete
MFLTPVDSDFFYGKVLFFSTSKLHALDDYWSKNSSHPTHEQMHQIIESVLIQRGETTLKQERLNLISNLEKSFSISNPVGRLSANIISFITKILIAMKFTKTTKISNE